MRPKYFSLLLLRLRFKRRRKGNARLARLLKPCILMIEEDRVLRSVMIPVRVFDLDAISDAEAQISYKQLVAKAADEPKLIVYEKNYTSFLANFFFVLLTIS
jgi:hypothetical protein